MVADAAAWQGIVLKTAIQYPYLSRSGRVSGTGGWGLKYVENAPNHVFTARVQAERVYYVQLKDLAL